MNDAELRAALDDAHARAVQAARAAREADEPRRQLQWYALFEESLRVAGLAAALRDPERLQNALENAAAAAAAVFALHDSTASPREDLETDTSMTNPWVWVHGLEAAIASGRREVERDLLNIPGARLESAQVVASPGLVAFAQGLRAVLGGAGGDARAALEGFPDDEPYYVTQAHALLAVLDGREPDLDAVAAAWDDAYAAPELAHEPERYLRLPVLALRALAERRSQS